LWNFSDGATSIDLDPVHEFQNPGTYTVTLTEFFDGISYRDSLNVIIHSRPAISLGDTILLYSGASLNLHAGGGYQAYQWSTGATDSIIETENQGNYSVQVMDWNCCLNSDSVYVKVFNYYIPDAFTPNGDGLNDIFKVIGLYGNIRFKLYIYDRWGHMIFNSDSMDHGWDGRYYGKPCPADTYVWIAHISFLGEDIITNGDVILKGTVLLLR
jgi:gliding motility-associated-like protein